MTIQHESLPWVTWGWIAIMVLMGVAMGVAGTYYFFQRDIASIVDRLDTIQQQITPLAPVPAPNIPGGKKHR